MAFPQECASSTWDTMEPQPGRDVVERRSERVQAELWQAGHPANHQLPWHRHLVLADADRPSEVEATFLEAFGTVFRPPLLKVRHAFGWKHLAPRGVIRA